MVVSPLEKLTLSRQYRAYEETNLFPNCVRWSRPRAIGRMRHVPRKRAVRGGRKLDEFVRYCVDDQVRWHVRCRSSAPRQARRLGHLYRARRSSHIAAQRRSETERLRWSRCLQIQTHRPGTAIHPGERQVQASPEKRAPDVDAVEEKIT